MPSAAPPAVAAWWDAECPDLSLPLLPSDAGESFRVTEPGDGTEPGTLRWAVQQANEQAGLDEVLIAAGLTVESTGEVAVSDDLILRGEDRGSSVVRNTGEDDLLRVVGTYERSFAFQIDSLTLEGTGSDSRGIYVNRGICGIGVQNSALNGFFKYGIFVDDSGFPEQMLVTNSSFSGTRGEDQDDGAIAFSNEGVNTPITITDSIFENNEATAISIEADYGTLGKGQGLTVMRTVFRNNTVVGYLDAVDPVVAAGIYVSGIYPEETYDHENQEVIEYPSGDALRIIDSVFENNSGAATGAISVGNSQLDSEGTEPYRLIAVEGSTFSGNHALLSQGEGVSAARDISVAESEVSDPGTTPALNIMRVRNSTFNGPLDQHAIAVGTFDGEVELEHVTMRGAAISLRDPNEGARLRIRNTVIDMGDQPSIDVPAESPLKIENGFSAFNIDPGFPLGSGSFLGTAEQFALGDLGSAAGGFAPAREPGVGSTLIDAAGPGGPELDQRGVTRPQGPAADIGSVEVVVAVPDPGTVRFASTGPVTVAEGENAVFRVLREGAAEGEARVSVTSLDGSAVAGRDFDAVAETLVWGDGEEGAKTVTVRTRSDAELEEDEDYTLVLSEPSEGFEIVAPETARGVITDVPVTTTPPTTKPPTTTPPTTEPPTTTGPTATGANPAGSATPGAGGLAETGGSSLTAPLVALALAMLLGGTILGLRRRFA